LPCRLLTLFGFVMELLRQELNRLIKT
jgi:hypothetical protein